jgi:hypothetical protein
MDGERDLYPTRRKEGWNVARWGLEDGKDGIRLDRSTARYIYRDNKI